MCFFFHCFSNLSLLVYCSFSPISFLFRIILFEVCSLFLSYLITLNNFFSSFLFLSLSLSLSLYIYILFIYIYIYLSSSLPLFFLSLLLSFLLFFSFSLYLFIYLFIYFFFPSPPLSFCLVILLYFISSLFSSFSLSLLAIYVVLSSFPYLISFFSGTYAEMPWLSKVFRGCSVVIGANFE